MTDLTKTEVLKNSHQGDHYKQMAIEPIQYIEANALGWHEANIVRYVSRWKFKNGVDDLKKARFYLDRLIELEEIKTRPNLRPSTTFPNA